MDEDNNPPGMGLVALPGFAMGGRVDRTGIALVHEGEYIVPALGSEAEISPDGAFGGLNVHLYLPVEVEIVGHLDDAQMRAIADYVFDQLQNALSARV